MCSKKRFFPPKKFVGGVFKKTLLLWKKITFFCVVGVSPKRGVFKGAHIYGVVPSTAVFLKKRRLRGETTLFGHTGTDIFLGGKKQCRGGGLCF